MSALEVLLLAFFLIFLVLLLVRMDQRIKRRRAESSRPNAVFESDGETMAV